MKEIDEDRIIDDSKTVLPIDAHDHSDHAESMNRTSEEHLISPEEEKGNDSPNDIVTIEAKPHILLIDDEPGVLASLRRLLRGENYDLQFALSGTQALMMLETQKYEIILTDMVMPEMTGTQLFEKVRDIYPDAIRIISSGYEEKPVILEALAKGFAHQYLPKPWSDKDALSLIATSLGVQKNLARHNLNAVLTSFANLPSKISNRIRIQQILDNPNSSLEVLAKEMEKNPALVAKLLQVANSVHFGLRQPVAGVKEAIVFIGTRYIEILLIAMELFQEIYYGLDAQARRYVDYLWLKSVRRANLTRKIAEEWNDPRWVSKAFVLGMMQDVGLLVRVHHQPKRFMRMIDLVRNEKKSLIETDRMTFSASHDAVGASLLTIWNFPDDVIHAVANHHNQHSEDPLTIIGMLADVLEAPENVKFENETFKSLVTEWYGKLYPYLTTYINQLTAN
jgi:HD-like signal output (HDOD) protein